MREQSPTVAIIDYGMGNLFSVKHALNQVGLEGTITASPEEILKSDAVILPGVGAFGDAMEALRNLNLINVLKEVVASDVFLIGICLGLQLLMSESFEFGHHKGLDLIKGQVIRFDHPKEDSRELKIPHVGWNCIYRDESNKTFQGDLWKNSPLEGLPDGEFMYFVHSLIVLPEDKSSVLSTSRYGQIDFCSSLRYRNIFACQFHPERSGPQGLRIYRTIASLIKKTAKVEEVNNV